MLATNLKEALNALAPDRELATAAELRDLYVTRPDSPLRKLEVSLRSSRDPQRILFSGHRGSGKSTELAKLSLVLEDQFFICRFSVVDRLNIYDITYVDVLFALGLDIVSAAKKQGLAISGELEMQIQAFFREVTTSTTTSSPVSGEAGLELNLGIGKLSAKMKVEDQTRKEVREKVSPRVSTLLDIIGLLTREIEAETGKRVLAIVEDLDKVDPATAKKLFYDHASSLGAPGLSIIYTFPIALRHDNDFLQVKMSFPTTFVLPIFKICTRDGAANEREIANCEEVLTRRVDARLFEPLVTRRLAEASGGVPRLLISLAWQACLEAMVDGKPIIDAEAVSAAIGSARRDYEVLLSRRQISTLKQIHASREVDKDEEHGALLHNLSCLEYRNDDVWYDVHPIVLPLLEG